MRGAKARRKYYRDAYYVREKKRQALLLGLALSTELGAPNRRAGGAGTGIPVPTSNNVFITDAFYGENPDRLSPVVLGSTIVYVSHRQLFDVDRSYFTINGTDIRLTAR